MRQDKGATKKYAIVAIILLFVSGAGAGIFVLVGRPASEGVNIDGVAEAVAVSPILAINGTAQSDDILDELYSPIGIALMGNYIVVADSMCDRVQIISAYASERVGLPGHFGLSYGHSGAFIDGFRENAMFMKPSGVFVTPEEQIIVADTDNHAIRLIIGEFVITLAGSGIPGFADGAETVAQFNSPRAAVMCPQGYIYIADTLNHVIRRMDEFGNVTLFAGAPGVPGYTDGALNSARFFQPSGLYVTASGVLYVADSANHAIRRIESGVVSTVAGRPGEPILFSNYTTGSFKDGPNAEARFDFPRDIALLPNGDILVADSLNHAIRLITPEGTRTLIGGGNAGAFSDSAENLQVNRPEGITTDGESIFVSDTLNNRILVVPLTERLLAGRPSRSEMLASTGLTTNSRFAFRGDIRIFNGSERINMGRVQPWLRGEDLFVPIRPFMEAMGAIVDFNEATGILTIIVGDTATVLTRDADYFVLRGTMVTTLQELMRLFPYTVEWFPELSLIVTHVPQDLRGGTNVQEN